jgi:hypothetical protein
MEWVPLVFITFKVAVLGTGMFFAIKWHYDQDRKDKNEAGEPQAPTEIRLFMTMIIAITLSLIGIVYAGCWGHAADGGRGGALGCAFTFVMSFMSRPSAETVLNHRVGQQGDILAEPAPTTLSEGLDQLANLKVQTERLRATFVFMLNSVQREKVYLGVAGVISTLAWKFGDIAAAWLNIGY